MKKKKIYAIICARGGSKGLKNKNIKKLSGKPLIAHSILQALSLKSIDKVVVSTDNKKIASISKKFGANIPFMRPKNLSTNKASEWKVWQHLIKFFKNKKDLPDIIISIPTTSPLRNVNDLNLAILKFMKNKKSDILITVTESKRNPYFNMVKVNKKGFVEVIINSKSKISNRQEAPKIFDVCTVAYVTTPEYILNNAYMFKGNVDYLEVKRDTSIDIDDKFDYEIVKKFY